MIGSHLIKTWSKTQANIALSSAESEFYGTLKTAQESIGLISLTRELGQDMRARLLVDASAALGVAQRLGVGKIRHLQTGALWLQEQELRKVMTLTKVPGADNRADIATKNVNREILERHIAGMSGDFASGRAEKAVQIHHLDRDIRQLKWELKKNASLTLVGNIDAGDDFTESEVNNIEGHVKSVEERHWKAVEKYIDEWERNFCRQEGGSLKRIREHRC